MFKRDRDSPSILQHSPSQNPLVSNAASYLPIPTAEETEGKSSVIFSVISTIHCWVHIGRADTFDLCIIKILAMAVAAYQHYHYLLIIVIC